MGRSVFETILGAVVLAVAGLFLAFAYNSSDLHVVKGYTITANFPMVDGLKEGIDVKINGVKIGSVSDMHLITNPGPNQYLVHVLMNMDPSVVLPTDTIAMIATESLLGGKYMSLEPGVDDDQIKTDGTGRVTRTQAPMRLDDLIGQLIYSNKRGDSSPPRHLLPTGSASETCGRSSSGSSGPSLMRAFLLAFLLCLLSAPAFAVVPSQDQPVAVLRALDKLTARVEELEVTIGQPLKFGTLLITLRACRVTPPEETPEAAAFLEISEFKPGEMDKPVFRGWMFASSPALSAMEHPVYDIWVTGCKSAPTK